MVHRQPMHYVRKMTLRNEALSWHGFHGFDLRCQADVPEKLFLAIRWSKRTFLPLQGKWVFPDVVLEQAFSSAVLAQYY